MSQDRAKQAVIWDLHRQIEMCQRRYTLAETNINRAEEVIREAQKLRGHLATSISKLQRRKRDLENA